MKTSHADGQTENSTEATTKHGWVNYVLEFLMLFMAVFLGFVAENIRESSGERETEKQYIVSLLNDLTTDVHNIDAVQARNHEAKQTGDSLFLLLTLPDFSKHTNAIYYLGRTYSSRSYFNLTDGTLKQLNNAGGLRLITRQPVVDSLQEYQYLYAEIVKGQELKEVQLINYRDLMSKVFDVRVLETMVVGETITRPKGNPPLFSQQKELLNELLMKAHFVKRNNAQLINMLDRMKRKALNLQAVIRREYPGVF